MADEPIPGEFSIVVVPPPKQKRSRATDRIKRAERAKMLLDFRRSGLTWEQAAKRVGISPAHAYRIAGQAIRDIPAESAAQMRLIETQRIDAIIHANWRNMELGDTYAGTLILKAIERRAKLFGLDQVSPETAAAIDAVMFALVSRLPTMSLAEKEEELRELTVIIDEPLRPGTERPAASAADAGAGAEPDGGSGTRPAPRRRRRAVAG